MLLILVLVLAAVIAFGVWRRFSAIQWIWLMFSIAIALVIAWLLILVFFVGPEMRRMGPPGQRPAGMRAGVPQSAGPPDLYLASRYRRPTSSQFTVFHHASR